MRTLRFDSARYQFESPISTLSLGVNRESNLESALCSYSSSRHAFRYVEKQRSGERTDKWDRRKRFLGLIVWIHEPYVAEAIFARSIGDPLLVPRFAPNGASATP
jgi:hypothetical protein